LDATITTEHSRLIGHLATPAKPGSAPGVVLCHGFPTGPRGAVGAAATFPELADRIAREVGHVALAFNCRGTGGSDGDFSVGGWLEDIRGAVSELETRPDVTGVRLVGIGEGGTLAISAAATDERVRGVATLAAPASLAEWARETGRLLDEARRIGMVRTPGFPESMSAWAREVAEVDGIAAARRLPPRAVLVLHGSADDVVPVSDARDLAEAAGASSELRVVQAAGHELRHDPRAIAALLGWLDRVS
jgi:putative redox protein